MIPTAWASGVAASPHEVSSGTTVVSASITHCLRSYVTMSWVQWKSLEGSNGRGLLLPHYALIVPVMVDLCLFIVIWAPSIRKPVPSGSNRALYTKKMPSYSRLPSWCLTYGPL